MIKQFKLGRQQLEIISSLLLQGTIIITNIWNCKCNLCHVDLDQLKYVAPLLWSIEPICYPKQQASWCGPGESGRQTVNLINDHFSVAVSYE